MSALEALWRPKDECGPRAQVRVKNTRENTRARRELSKECAIDE
jgi:hypothetical protein